MAEAALAFIGNPQVHSAIGALALAVFGLVQGSDWYKEHIGSGFVMKSLVSIIDHFIALQWHSYLRDATDRAKFNGDPNALISAQKASHEEVKSDVLIEVEKRKLPVDLPKGALDALIVQRVKAFKNGATLHTGPTTKGM